MSEARTHRARQGTGEWLADPDIERRFAGGRGDYSFEMLNDDYQQVPLPIVAERARRSTVWLGKAVRHRSAPLPGRMRLIPFARP